MDFKIQQKIFADLLDKAYRFVGTGSSMPILKGLLLKVTHDGELIIKASNLEQGITICSDEINNNGGEFSVVLPADKLRSIVKALPPRTVKLKRKLQKSGAEIESDGVDYELNGFSVEEFPEFPELDSDQGIKLDGEGFKEIIDKVSVCAAAGDQKPGLKAVLLKSDEDNGIDFCATNTFRMALYEDKQNSGEFKLLAPANMLQIVSRVLDEDQAVRMAYDQSHILFEQDKMKVYSRQIEGKFPNYDQVIPKSYDAWAEVEKEKLMAAARRAGMINDTIQLTCDDVKLHIKAEGEDGEGREQIYGIRFEDHKEEGYAAIKIDASYLQDAIKAIDGDTVRFEFNGEINPLMVTDPARDNYTHLIMPIRPEA